MSPRDSVYAEEVTPNGPLHSFRLAAGHQKDHSVITGLRFSASLTSGCGSIYVASDLSNHA